MGGTGTQREVKRQAGDQQPRVNMREAVTKSKAVTHTHTHRLVKRQAEVLQPNASTWEANTHSLVKNQAMKILYLNRSLKTIISP